MIEDAVSAHALALDRAGSIGFARYIISATTPFRRDDAGELSRDAAGVVQRLFPDYRALFQMRGWRLFPRIDRVYVNELARLELGWRPRYDFRHVLDSLRMERDPRSALACEVGSKGYHAG